MADAPVVTDRPPGLHILFLRTVADRITPDMIRDHADRLAGPLSDLLWSQAAAGEAMGEGLLDPPVLTLARALVIDPVPAPADPSPEEL